MTSTTYGVDLSRTYSAKENFPKHKKIRTNNNINAIKVKRGLSWFVDEQIIKLKINNEQKDNNKIVELWAWLLDIEMLR